MSDATVLPLADAVETLRQLRMVRDAQAEVIKARKAALAKALADDETTLKLLSAQVEVAEMAASNAAMMAYQTDPEKPSTLLPGVTVKVFKVAQYDAEEAFAWAQKKDMFITRPQLMTKEFETFAMSPAANGSGVPVQIVDEPRVQFAKVLPGQPLPVAPIDLESLPWDKPNTADVTGWDGIK
jgi:hypothetical protein